MGGSAIAQTIFEKRIRGNEWYEMTGCPNTYNAYFGELQDTGQLVSATIIDFPHVDAMFFRLVLRFASVADGL